MPNYLHRTSKEYLRSIPESQLPEAVANYIRDPDLSAVAGFDSRYWTITGDIVTLQSPAERAATDAAIDAQSVTNNRGVAAAAPDALAKDSQRPIDGIQLRELIELFNKRDNYLTNRIIELQEDLQAIKASSGPADNIRAAIRVSYSPTATRPRSDAIQDYKDDINAGNADT